MEAQPGGTVTVRALVDCPEIQADLVARKLLRLTSVRDVVLNYAAAKS
jgi:hypothetical protein